ncbi:MAG: T9SS type A sorting domain-containing protein, partial [Flavobacteriales bacterium]|nr:T9SS type A sorting domain-containing protein [Flavobacteriales bacterium]
QLSPDRFIITGVFDKINGVDRGGIAMIDSSGALVEDVFDGLGCGEYEYAVSSGSTTYKYIAGIVPTQDGSFYIHGGYHGYDDGSTNDTTQRMVSRLYGLEVGVREQEYSTVLSLFPNPSDGPLRIASSGLNWLGAGITVFDPQGRKVAEGTLLEEAPELDLRDLPSGCYVVQVTTTQGQRLMAKWTRE